jgi:hypothetical protein|tara:strand:+ start:394 stop:765 length:372 start_codon:yes stop_codon:yes gene_type:complete
MNFGYQDDEFHYDEEDDQFHYDEEDESEFKGAMFSIAIEDSELDDILSDKDQIMIKQDFNCYCFHVKREPRYFRIKCPKGKSLTNKQVIKELIEQRMILECNHVFLEGFIKKTDYQYELMTGS